jgi:hypothetical protein
MTDTCPICFNKINEGETTSCGHTFCLKCINEWFKKNNNCPLCRTKKCRKSLRHIFWECDRLEKLQAAVTRWEMVASPIAQQAWRYFSISQLKDFSRKLEVDHMKNTSWLTNVIEPYIAITLDDPDTLLYCRIIRRHSEIMRKL